MGLCAFVLLLFFLLGLCLCHALAALPPAFSMTFLQEPPDKGLPGAWGRMLLFLLPSLYLFALLYAFFKRDAVLFRHLFFSILFFACTLAALLFSAPNGPVFFLYAAALILARIYAKRSPALERYFAGDGAQPPAAASEKENG